MRQKRGLWMYVTAPTKTQPQRHFDLAGVTCYQRYLGVMLADAVLPGLLGVLANNAGVLQPT